MFELERHALPQKNPWTFGIQIWPKIRSYIYQNFAKIQINNLQLKKL